MRRGWIISLALLGASAVRGGESSPDPAALFYQARQAYDAGRFADAAAEYQKMPAAGYDGREIRFNLANALFRAGRPGAAIAQYRRAQYFAPGDPDTRANLAFARQATGAATHDPARVHRWLRRISRAAWRTAARAVWWLGALAVIAALLDPRRRVGAARPAACWLAALAVCGAGWGSWAWLDRYPEAVVTGSEQIARFAPMPDAAPHFRLPTGSLVEWRGGNADWAQVRLGAQTGWVPADALERLDRPGAAGASEQTFGLQAENAIRD